MYPLGLFTGRAIGPGFIGWVSLPEASQPRLQPGGSQLPLCGLFTGTAVGLGLGATYTLPRLTQAPRASLLLLAASPTSPHRSLGTRHLQRAHRVSDGALLDEFPLHLLAT